MGNGQSATKYTAVERAYGGSAVDENIVKLTIEIDRYETSLNEAFTLAEKIVTCELSVESVHDVTLLIAIYDALRCELLKNKRKIKQFAKKERLQEAKTEHPNLRDQQYPIETPLDNHLEYLKKRETVYSHFAGKVRKRIAEVKSTSSDAKSLIGTSPPPQSLTD